MNRAWPIHRVARPLVRWACWLLLTAAVSALGQEQTYVVKRSDTLYGIARQFGVSPGTLADRNGISRTTQVYVGQRLLIPGRAAATAPARSKVAPSPLNSSLQRGLEKAPVEPRRWKYIVIHHSGTEEGTLKSLDRFHREERHMENGLAYHFLIGNGNGMGDGEVAIGNRWKEQLDGGHLRSEQQNRIALGICLIGNFDQRKPTPKQLISLEQLVRALLKRCDLPASAVKTHHQINIVHTKCPGSKFPEREFLARFKKPGR